jgi:filamentous hemagglutinin
LSSKLADQTKAVRDAVSDGTDSTLLGNIAANIVSGLGGALVGGSAGAAGAANVNLYNQGHDTGEAAADKKAASLTQQVADAYNYLQQLRQSVGDAVSSAAGQFVGQMNADARAKASEPATDLMAQGTANGLAAGVGMGGGKPPAQSPGAVLVDGAGQALAGGGSSGASVAGYGAGNTVFNDGGDNAQASNGGNSDASLPMGSKSNQFNQPKNPTYQPTRNTPGTVEGTDYAGHAFDRMQDRGLTPSVIQNTIENGVPTPSRGGTTVFYDSVNNVSVVTNSEGKVITVKYGK